MLGLIMAAVLEARPFLDDFFTEAVQDAPFPTFIKNDFFLVISGIGKSNAAMGTAFGCIRFRPSRILNLGAAGATDHSCALGEVYQIMRVIEYDRPDLKTGAPFVHAPQTLDGLPAAILATQDRPVRDPALRREISRVAGLVDMEAAAVVQVCAAFGVPCHVLKLVTDTPDHTTSDDIVKNIKIHRDRLFEFFMDMLQRKKPNLNS